MSINKYTLGTIVGTALLGLAKSKFGGRNEETPLIVSVGSHSTNDTIFLSENDIRSNPELMGITELPVLGRLSFTLVSSTDRPGESIRDQLSDYEEDLKRYYFDENEGLDDNNEEKQDWEDWTDVPDWYIEGPIDDKRQELQEEHYQEIGDTIHRFMGGVMDQISEKLNDNDEEYFHFLQKVKKSRPIYVYIEPYEYFHEAMYEESDVITLISIFKIYINSENLLVTQTFIHGFEEMLDNLEDFDDFEDISVMRVEGKWLAQPKISGPKLRKR